VFADMPGDRPGIRIVAPARRKTDDETNRLPLVKVIGHGWSPRRDDKSQTDSDSKEEN
jgi:hypothetical protein